MVDWTKPIEAVHTDGRVVAVTLAKGPDGCGDYETTECPDSSTANTWWDSLGTSRVAYCPWSIRNVAPAWRTSVEQLDRMDALLARIVKAAGAGKRLPITDEWYVVSEAKAIIAAREPVDPRFETVVSALISCGPPLDDCSRRRLARDVLAALDK